MQYQKPRGTCQPGYGEEFKLRRGTSLPVRCQLCGGAAFGISLCGPCLRGLPGIARPCPGCALPLTNAVDSRCGACRVHPPPWDRLHAALAYGFPVDRLVRAFKFHRNLAAGRALAVAMRLRGGPDRDHPAWLVPVPLHRFRLLARGYDQAALLARELAHASAWRVRAGVLRRRRRTRPQSGLDASARRRNLRSAFSARRLPGDAPLVVLVDDVMTTGSTAAECARMLRRAGARRVEVWVTARALKEPGVD